MELNGGHTPRDDRRERINVRKRIAALALTICLAVGVALPALAETSLPSPVDSAAAAAAEQVVGDDPTAAAETDAALNQIVNQAIDPAVKEQIQERILIIKDLRAQGDALAAALKAQRETNQRLWQSIRSDLAPVRDQVKDLRAEYQSRVEGQVQPLRDQLKTLQGQFADARKNKDAATVKAIMAQMQDLRAQLKATMQSLQGQRDQVKALVDDLRAKRGALMPKIEELKSLRQQAEDICTEIASLRERKADAWEAVRQAGAAKDANGVLAALDQVIALKRQILVDGQRLLNIMRQIGQILAAIN